MIARAGKGGARVERAEDRRARERSGGHPQERQAADHAEGPRPVEAAPYRCAAAAVATGTMIPPPNAWTSRAAISWPRSWLAPARAEPIVKANRPEQEQPAGAPQVGQAAGEGHRPDVDEQVAIDHPGGRAQLGPVGQAGHDRRQGHGRDHQLEAGEEHRDAQDQEQD